jgi:hypothetical protein
MVWTDFAGCARVGLRDDERMMYEMKVMIGMEASKERDGSTFHFGVTGCCNRWKGTW